MSHNLQLRIDRVLGALGVVLVLATIVALMAGGGGGDAPAAASAVDRVEIKDFKYLPAAITVGVGTKITWTNVDTAPHTSSSGASPNPDGIFESGTMKKDQSRSVTVTERGTFKYYCAFHPFMQATVTVK